MKKLKRLKVNDRIKIKKWPDTSWVLFDKKKGKIIDCNGKEGKILECKYEEQRCSFIVELDCAKGKEFLAFYNTYDEFDEVFSLIKK